MCWGGGGGVHDVCWGGGGGVHDVCWGGGDGVHDVCWGGGGGVRYVCWGGDVICAGEEVVYVMYAGEVLLTVAALCGHLYCTV